MKTKAQIAKEMYGESLKYLSNGQAAAVTRRFNAQEAEVPEYEDDEDTLEEEDNSGVNSVKFGRPGINGVKECFVEEGKNVEDAFNQTGLTINLKKEGFIVKKSSHYAVGQIVKVTDKVHDGDVFYITLGVDSSN